MAEHLNLIHPQTWPHTEDQSLPPQAYTHECYVVHNSKAVVVSSANFSSPDKAAIKQIISEIIEKLRT
jgi:hypothetical protein